MKASEEQSTNTTLVSAATLLAQAVIAKGLDLDAFLAQLGIRPDEYNDPNGRIPVPLMQRAWRLAVEWSGDECFGLGLADVVQPAALHGIGLSMISSNSLREAIERVVCYQRFLSTAFKISLNPEGDHYRIDFSTERFRATPDPASIDGTLAVFVAMSRITAGSTVRPIHVYLQRKSPATCATRYRHYFGCPVTFSSVSNQILFDRETFDRPLPTANPDLARINDQVVIEYLERFDPQTLSARLRTLIIDALPGGTISEESIVQRLNMSLRSLQRQLKNERTSYKEILAGTRRQLAQEYLSNSERQIIEIGYMLGFSEPSNFSRAFKRWTGQSPLQFREASRERTQTHPPQM
ncbi:MAG: AraC family transcriptional regulator [gamma proteobacterium endosymbiont of Lamellibrachia anaximandri]|nr:AraC family transcriptional regulator [gamma proteobacterium endosymbiont of Lamellibrachia anaximandri]MBL3617424.1 AraC family transcriptional regulator [gamma proteobacterium endosymbiont of Lamellibrachia anaximandri]